MPRVQPMPPGNRFVGIPTQIQRYPIQPITGQNYGSGLAAGLQAFGQGIAPALDRRRQAQAAEDAQRARMADMALVAQALQGGAPPQVVGEPATGQTTVMPGNTPPLPMHQRIMNVLPRLQTPQLQNQLMGVAFDQMLNPQWEPHDVDGDGKPDYMRNAISGDVKAIPKSPYAPELAKIPARFADLAGNPAAMRQAIMAERAASRSGAQPTRERRVQGSRQILRRAVR